MTNVTQGANALVTAKDMLEVLSGAATPDGKSWRQVREHLLNAQRSAVADGGASSVSSRVQAVMRLSGYAAEAAEECERFKSCTPELNTAIQRFAFVSLACLEHPGHDGLIDAADAVVRERRANALSALRTALQAVLDAAPLNRQPLMDAWAIARKAGPAMWAEDHWACERGGIHCALSPFTSMVERISQHLLLAVSNTGSHPSDLAVATTAQATVRQCLQLMDQYA